MSDFEDVKPYTQAELDQQAIWANEFDQWWENEGQYQRAGGGQYERTFAWWAWLNQEQKQQAIIDEHTEVIKIQDADLRKYEKQIESLKAQLNNMEACYIEKKKELDELEAAKRDYVCDCGYLDSPDYEECDCRKHSEDLANEAIAEIVKKANFAGLEELLDELKCRAIKHGVLLNKQALRGAND